MTVKTVKILEFSEGENGEIRSEVSTKTDKHVVVKRIQGGDELSEAELSAVLEEALRDSGLDADHDVDIDIIVEEVIEETHRGNEQ